MKVISPFTFTLLVAAVSLPALAQQGTDRPAAPATQQECPKPVAKHHHGVERNIPAPAVKPMPCGGETVAAEKTPKKPLHDHAKFHKNM